MGDWLNIVKGNQMLSNGQGCEEVHILLVPEQSDAEWQTYELEMW